MLEKEQQDPKKLRYPRNPDLDPQLVWRGKDEQDWSLTMPHSIAPTSEKSLIVQGNIVPSA